MNTRIFYSIKNRFVKAHLRLITNCIRVQSHENADLKLVLKIQSSEKKSENEDYNGSPKNKNLKIGHLLLSKSAATLANKYHSEKIKHTQAQRPGCNEQQLSGRK
jgi:tRNA A22 N-methylase